MLPMLGMGFFWFNKLFTLTDNQKLWKETAEREKQFSKNGFAPGEARTLNLRITYPVFCHTGKVLSISAAR